MTEDSSSDDSAQCESVRIRRPAERTKASKTLEMKLPLDLVRLIRWLEVTRVIEPRYTSRVQFVNNWEACEMRRDAGGFEDDSDISPITDDEGSDSRDEVCQIDWRNVVKQVKSSDAARQELINLRDKMEASRLINSRLQVPNDQVHFLPETIDKGTKVCKRELGLVESDDATEDQPTKAEGREIFCRLLPHMMDATVHEKHEKARTWQWDLIHQVSRSASDRTTDAKGVIYSRWQTRKTVLQNRKDERKRKNSSATMSKSKKSKKTQASK